MQSWILVVHNTCSNVVNGQRDTCQHSKLQLRDWMIQCIILRTASSQIKKWDTEMNSFHHLNGIRHNVDLSRMFACQHQGVGIVRLPGQQHSTLACIHADLFYFFIYLFICGFPMMSIVSALACTFAGAGVRMEMTAAAPDVWRARHRDPGNESDRRDRLRRPLLTDDGMLDSRLPSVHVHESIGVPRRTSPCHDPYHECGVCTLQSFPFWRACAFMLRMATEWKFG